MKIILVHNAEAGYKQPSKLKLIEVLKSLQLEVILVASDADRLEDKIINTNADYVLVAGGDGTVHRIARLLLSNPIPMAILPIGTANNIAMSLSTNRQVLSKPQWLQSNPLQISTGKAHFDGEHHLFFESVGMGALATMMHKYEVIKKIKKPEYLDRIHKLRYLYHFMYNIIPDLEAHDYKINIDGKKYDGSYLWVEIINSPFFGPHLSIGSTHRLTDDKLNVLLVRNEDRAILSQYFNRLLDGEEVVAPFDVIDGREITISTKNEILHIDDVLQKRVMADSLRPTFQLNISVQKEALSFISPPIEL